MKIAIILPCHMRSWDFCRQNFLENVYDKDHEIDVFVDTYFETFRTDYHLHKENEMNVVLEENEIKSKFDGINVVHFNIENELLGQSWLMHKRKLLMAYSAVANREAEYGNYDLIVKYRFDILADYKLQYNYYKRRLENNPNIIFMADGGVWMTDENDMAAITSSNNMKLYINRLNEYNNDDPMLFHSSLSYIANKYKIKYVQNIGISIVRLDGNRNFRIEK